MHIFCITCAKPQIHLLCPPLSCWALKYHCSLTLPWICIVLYPEAAISFLDLKESVQIWEWPFPEMLALMPVPAGDDITSSFTFDVLRSEGAVSPLTLRAWSLREVEIPQHGHLALKGGWSQNLGSLGFFCNIAFPDAPHSTSVGQWPSWKLNGAITKEPGRVWSQVFYFLTVCVTLEKSLNFAESSSPHLHNGNDITFSKF